MLSNYLYYNDEKFGKTPWVLHVHIGRQLSHDSASSPLKFFFSSVDVTQQIFTA